MRSRITSIILCISILVTSLTLSSGGVSFDEEKGQFRFDSEAMMELFSDTHNVELSYDKNEDSLKMRVTGGDPYALLDFSKLSGKLYAADFDYAVFTYKSPSSNSSSATQAEIFISAGSVGSPAAGKSVLFSLKKGEYISQIIDLSSLSWWSGQIHSMRIDCFCNANVGDTMYVDSLILCSDYDEARAVVSDRVNKGFEDDPYRGTDLECIEYDMTKYTSPFWKGNIVYSEAVSPIQNKDGSYTYELMYTPDEVIAVYSGNYSAYYKEGVDYTVSGNKLTVLPTGNIPTWEYGYINRSWKDESDYAPLYPMIGGGYGVYGKNEIFMEGFLNVTYTHSDTWEHYTPTSKSDMLPRTTDALKNNKSYKMVLFGDSIAGGANSSKYRDIYPYADYWYEQLEDSLRYNYGFTNLSFTSVSQGGQTASGMVDYFRNNILPMNPDLYILEYGVNDAQNESVSSNASTSDLKREFKNGIGSMIDLARAQNPHCEILLVSPIYTNVTFFREDMFEAVRDACFDLESEYSGVAVANVTDLQGSLMEFKLHSTFLGDNLCHPNDYMARMFAMTCLATLIPEEIGYEAYVPEGLPEKEPVLTSIEPVLPEGGISPIELGGQLEISNIFLKLIYDNSEYNTTIPVESSMLSGFDSSTEGEKTVTITYEGFTTQFSVTVFDPIITGDIDRDGEISLLDLFSLKLFIKQKAIPTDAEIAAGDIDGDGELTMVDSFEIRYRVAKGAWR